MSEPCRHERDAVAVHGALGAAQLEIKALRAELADARATIAERDASIAQLATRLAADDQDATIERVRALCDDGRYFIAAHELRAALEATS